MITVSRNVDLLRLIVAGEESPGEGLPYAFTYVVPLMLTFCPE